MNKVFLILCGLLFSSAVQAADGDFDLGLDDFPVSDSSVSESQNASQNTQANDGSSLFGGMFNFLGISLDGSSTDASENHEKDEASSISLEELQKKADEGDLEAQLNLGYTYLYGGNGTNTDYKQAFHYYELAAEQNSAIALNNLGSLYFNGIGTDVNYTKAISYFDRAAQAGSNDAAVNLAIIYLGADNKNKSINDFKKIHELLNQAKDTSVAAKYLLGYSYYKGFVVNKDDKKAFELIKQAADDEYDEAQYILSYFYTDALGTTKNYNRAVQYLRNASNQGYADALVRLADILADGKIYSRDIKKAHVLYNVASVLGKKDAAVKRDKLESKLQIEDLLNVQADAENYKAVPSQTTSIVRQTFGDSLKIYVDSNIDAWNKLNKKKAKGKQ